jgi:hypothetical protein
MPRLLRADGNRFFLVPEGLALPPGDLEVQDLTGRRELVDPAAVAPHAVDEATAKAAAMETMARIRDNAKGAVRAAGDIAKEIADRKAELLRATAALRDQAQRPRVPTAPPALPAGLRDALAGASEQLARLLDPDGAATAEGLAWLTTVAEAVKARGGPDWTDEPASIPDRLREAIGDPAFVERLGGLARDVRDGAPVPGGGAGPDGAAEPDDGA